MPLSGRAELKYLFAIAMGAVTVWSFLVPDAPKFPRPDLARMFFWHFPCPMMLTLFMFVGCYFSLRYFLRIGKGISQETDPVEKRTWDVRAEAALELGLVYAILTMVTGMIFSKAQWGALWSWDPRQTSFLIALLMYGAYFAVRTAIGDPEKRASNAAAYILAACLPLVFLIFVYPRLPQVISLHPSDTIMGGNLKGQYLYVTLAALTLVTILSVWLYKLRVLVEMRSFDNHGQLETSSGGAAPTAVVRPVSVSHES